MFGRYRLLGRLAIGGMAEVWAAQLLATGGFVKPMVIKRVLPELASNPSFLRMLMVEARVAARLSHGNVCAVFELGAVGGEYYLAMEYLRGAPLTHVIRAGGPMRPALAAAILAQACDGLHYAHEQRDSQGKLLGLVHRDVSPHNLFVTVDGVVKVLDFGIAKVDDGSMTDRTEAGKVKGKLPYMSPEQLAAESLDRRSDVWSLGVVLFELITGKRLFNGPGPGATVDAIRNARIPTLESMGIHAPALDEVLGRALCKSPQWRYQTAAELRRAVIEAIQPAALAGHEELTELVWARCGAQVRTHDRLFDVEDPDPQVVERLPLRAEPSSLLALPDAVTQATRDVIFFDQSSSHDVVVGRVDTRAATEDDEVEDGSRPGEDTIDQGGAGAEDTIEEPAEGAAQRQPRAPSVITQVEPVSGSRARARLLPAPPVESTLDVAPAPDPSRAALWRALWVGAMLALAIAAAVLWVTRGERKDAAPQAAASQAAAPGKAPAPAAARGTVTPIATEAGTATGTGTEAATGTATEAAMGTGTETEAVTGTETEAVTGTETEAATGTGTATETETETDRAAVAPDRPAKRQPAPPKRTRKPAPPPEPPTRAVAAKQAPGKLSIDARPWATIYLDGKKLGPTPIVGREVAAGDHTIRAVAEDGTEKTLRVRVEPGETVRRKVTW